MRTRRRASDHHGPARISTRDGARVRTRCPIRDRRLGNREKNGRALRRGGPRGGLPGLAGRHRDRREGAARRSLSCSVTLASQAVGDTRALPHCPFSTSCARRGKGIRSGAIVRPRKEGRMRILLVVLAVLVFAPAALAQEPPPDEPDGGPIEEPIEDDCGGGGDVRPLCVAETACRTVHAWTGWKNIYGVFYWKYWEDLRWCWNISTRKITSWNRNRGAECCMQLSGWGYEGHIGSQITGGVGSGYVRAWTQGKFRQCYAYCFNTKTPCVAIRGNGGGSWSASWNASC